MQGRPRRSVVAAFGFALALGLASCSSSNEGKIVGNWGTTEGPMVERFKATLPAGTNVKAVSAVFVFKPEGEFTYGYLVGDKYVSIMTGRYKLGAGEVVELDDIKVTEANAQPGTAATAMKVKAAVDGNTMTLTDAAGSTTYHRLVAVKSTAPGTSATSK